MRRLLGRALCQERSWLLMHRPGLQLCLITPGTILSHHASSGSCVVSNDAAWWPVLLLKSYFCGPKDTVYGTKMQL